MKLRQPKTVADAVTRIMGLFGADRAGEILGGKSGSLVRKFSDPDIDTWPNVMQAVELDVAFVNLGGQGEYPILSAMKAAADGLTEPVRHEPECLLQRMTQATAELGDVARFIHDLNGRVLTPNKAAVLREEIREAMEVLQQMDKDVIAHCDNVTQLHGAAE